MIVLMKDSAHIILPINSATGYDYICLAASAVLTWTCVLFHGNQSDFCSVLCQDIIHIHRLSLTQSTDNFQDHFLFNNIYGHWITPNICLQQCINLHLLYFPHFLPQCLSTWNSVLFPLPDHWAPFKLLLRFHFPRPAYLYRFSSNCSLSIESRGGCFSELITSSSLYITAFCTPDWSSFFRRFDASPFLPVRNRHKLVVFTDIKIVQQVWLSMGPGIVLNP